MTYEELEKAKEYANEKGTFEELFAGGNDFFETDEGVTFKAWVFVPREAYQTGSEVVSGG